MVKVPDTYTLAALRYLEGKLGRKCGDSTVVILCDGGERYLHSCYNDDWLKANGFDIAGPVAEITGFSDDASSATWPLPIHRLA